MASSVNPPENALFSTETSDGETTHFICQSSGRLTEETFEDGWDAPLPVGSAKAGTNGCYVLLGEGQVRDI
jgi:YD repeat-containing protein